MPMRLERRQRRPGICCQFVTPRRLPVTGRLPDASLVVSERDEPSGDELLAERVEEPVVVPVGGS
jgi:hypothetical protein